MSDWLSTRLTPSKAKEARWVEFSKVLEGVWEEFFDPDISRLKRLRSCYLADDADLIKQIRQMGDYFSFDRPNPEDRPISFAWRRLELEYKDMELILASVFRRHYSNLPVTWFPIFAPKNEPYGTVFQVAEGPWPERKNVPPNGMFLTSRGRLGTDYGYLLSLGLNKQSFLDKALPLLMRTKPLHIVYDGPLWYIRFDIPVDIALNPDLLWWERDCGQFELQFTVIGSRFDYTAADERNLDIQSALCTWHRENYQRVPFIPDLARLWHLDFYLRERFPETWMPLDILIAGHEGDNNPLMLAVVISDETFDLRMDSILKMEMEHPKSHRLFAVPASISAKKEISVNYSFNSAFPAMGRLDHYPCFDDFPADKYPLDMPVGGKYV